MLEDVGGDELLGNCGVSAWGRILGDVGAKM